MCFAHCKKTFHLPANNKSIKMQSMGAFKMSESWQTGQYNGAFTLLQGSPTHLVPRITQRKGYITWLIWKQSNSYTPHHGNAYFRSMVTTNRVCSLFTGITSDMHSGWNESWRHCDLGILVKVWCGFWPISGQDQSIWPNGFSPMYITLLSFLKWGLYECNQYTVLVRVTCLGGQQCIVWCDSTFV